MGWAEKGELHETCAVVGRPPRERAPANSHQPQGSRQPGVGWRHSTRPQAPRLAIDWGTAQVILTADSGMRDACDDAARSHVRAVCGARRRGRVQHLCVSTAASIASPAAIGIAI